MLKLENHRTVLLTICAAIVLITLFFGLKPKGFRFHNQVEWLHDRNGISFRNIGMAYSQKPLEEIGISDSITIVAALKPYRAGRELSKIISIVDPNGQEILSIEQWIAGLMVTLWDSSGKRLGKLGIKDALSTDAMRLAAATVDRSGMKLFGENPQGKWEARRMPLPPNFFAGGRLVVGLGANGRNRWRGEMEGLALFKEALSEQDIRACDSRRPAAIFLFNEHGGREIHDRSGNRWDLHIPLYPKIFKYEVLSILPNGNRITPSLLQDMAVNLLGFIPLGVCLYAAFSLFGLAGRKAILSVVACALLLSLSIELAQAFIPTRSSQLIDVVLNTLGAWLGTRLPRIARIKGP